MFPVTVLQSPKIMILRACPTGLLHGCLGRGVSCRKQGVGAESKAYDARNPHIA
jgi:hypothetical protein